MRNNKADVIQYKRHPQDTEFLPQEKRAFLAFSRQPKTMLMVANEKDIYRANLCCYIARWRKNDKVHLIRFGICPISKHRAGFYSTKNPTNERIC